MSSDAKSTKVVWKIVPGFRNEPAIVKGIHLYCSKTRAQEVIDDWNAGYKNNGYNLYVRDNQIINAFYNKGDICGEDCWLAYPETQPTNTTWGEYSL